MSYQYAVRLVKSDGKLVSEESGMGYDEAVQQLHTLLQHVGHLYGIEINKYKPGDQ